MVRLFFFLIFGVLYSPKLQSQLSISWQKTMGGSSADEALDIVSGADGTCLVVGRTASINGDIFGQHGGFDIFAVMLSAQGSILWKRLLGGSDNDVPFSVTKTVDGHFVIAGLTFSNDGDITGLHGDSDGVIIKLSQSGEVLWKRVAGGSGLDGFWSVAPTSDGGCITTGYCDSPDGDIGYMLGNTDCWTVKFDHAGNIEWQTVLGGTNEDISYKVRQTSDGGFAFIGQTSSFDQDVSYNNGNVDFWFVKLSATGQVEWEKTFGGANSDAARDLCETEGGFYVVGYTGSGNTGDVSGNHGYYDVWLIKIDVNGNLQWQKAIGGSQPDRAYQLELLDDGSCIIVGGIESSDGDFPDNDGGADLALINVSPDGNLLWQQTFGGSKAEVGFGIDRTNDNGFVVAGYTWSSNGDLAGFANRGKDDFWILKLSPESMSATADAEAEPILLSPNPTADEVNLSIPEPFSEFTATVTDESGRVVVQKNIVNGTTLSLGSLPAGIYTLQARMPDGRVHAGRLVKY